MRKSISPTRWTREMDLALSDAWFRLSVVDCGKLFGITADRARQRARKIYLPSRKSKEFRDRVRDLWIAEVRKVAEQKKIAARDIMDGTRRPEIVRARWEAWSNVVGSGECLSIGMLARVSGFDHSAILYGVARYRRASTKYFRCGRWVPAVPVMEAAE